MSFADNLYSQAVESFRTSLLTDYYLLSWPGSNGFQRLNLSRDFSNYFHICCSEDGKSDRASRHSQTRQRSNGAVRSAPSTLPCGKLGFSLGITEAAIRASLKKWETNEAIFAKMRSHIFRISKRIELMRNNLSFDVWNRPKIHKQKLFLTPVWTDQ